eukprot:CAMPEP_0114502544 /NCGR_PEP_ID=MMETSP0109-20121206/9156_1 /TAXON_ID=29199 /ORGANISM="Chlorarachnion reptans, Strain CCCM449" /LENGTH=167 /DNA_ID=CAMNT_0001680483 /DNA_START=382 /DNA_END=885 /DNA_ORIENTATION=-
MFMLHCVIVILTLGNVIFLFVCGLLLSMEELGGASGSFMANQTMCGVLEILFGLVAVQCLPSNEPTIQFCCLPVHVPTKWYPVILLGLYQFLRAIDFGMMSCLAAGCLYAHYPEIFQASTSRLREWEKSRWMSLIVASPGFGFIPLDPTAAGEPAAEVDEDDPFLSL